MALEQGRPLPWRIEQLRGVGLTKRGMELESGCVISQRKRAIQNLDHTVAIGHLYAALRAELEYRKLQLRHWRGDHLLARGAYDHVTVAAEREALPVLPDTLFVLQDTRYYVEVDLPALVESGDPEAFLYFYGFFHRSAFEDQSLGVAALLRASADYAHTIGDTLKIQVYDALRQLAQGFLDYPANRLPTDQATLKTIYDHSLIVLYRLLFILYAEARAADLFNDRGERHRAAHTTPPILWCST